MTPHELGRRLRDQVQRDHLAGRSLEVRRLQAVIGDLCSGDHAELVAPLRYLVLSAPFASAAAQDPPLSDARSLQRFSAELGQMYAASVCQRLQPVLEGLMGLPERSSASGAAPSAAFPWTDVSAAAGAAMPAQAAPTLPHPAQPGLSSLNVLLAFLTGVLLMLLAGVGLVLWQRQQSLPLSSASAPVDAPPATGLPVPDSASRQPSTLEANQAEASSPAASLDRAVGGIQELYSALSAKDFVQARARYGAGVADQFDEGFFRQFERVSVQDLRSTSQTGNTVNLEGLVTFVWPDGTTQTETRTFSVNTSGEPPVITASEFGRVVKPR